MPVVPVILYRQNSVNDQHQQREEHEVNQFGFIRHETPPLERKLAELDLCIILSTGFSLDGCLNTGKFCAEIFTTEKHTELVEDQASAGARHAVPPNSNSGSDLQPRFCRVAPTVFAVSDCAESVATSVRFGEYARE
jgi:hypothetical protein